MDKPISSAKSTPSETNSYSGCFTCGTIVACVDMFPFLVEMSDGSTLATPGYECADCHGCKCGHSKAMHRPQSDGLLPHSCRADGCPCAVISQ